MMNDEKQLFQNRADVKENLKHAEIKATVSAHLFSDRGAVSVAALLVAKNIKQKDIAKKYFVTPAELNRVIKGKRKTAYIRKIIAIELGMDVNDLWN
jgi:predicted XRE-type DNA-binding protein